MLICGLETRNFIIDNFMIKYCYWLNSLNSTIISVWNAPLFFQNLMVCKEYIEGRRVEPFEFLLKPKMGLLGSQASTKKSPILNYEQLFSSVFSTFHGQKNMSLIFLYNVVSPLKSCLLEKFKESWKKFGKCFWEV